MRLPVIAAALMIAALPLTTMASEPNLQPGEWEYRNTTTFDGSMDIPEQSHTNRECVTAADIEDGLVTPDEAEMGDCTVSEREVTRDSMSYTMTCSDGQGGEMVMNARMRFMGDRTEGVIEGVMDSAAGQMNVRTEMEGRRVGDC